MAELHLTEYVRNWHQYKLYMPNANSNDNEVDK